jgi:hypothetical protein
MIWIGLLALLIAVVVFARMGNPNRRKNIDANMVKILSAKKDLEIPIEHASDWLENEYRNQFKGYSEIITGMIECYRDSKNSTTLILARRFPTAE